MRTNRYPIAESLAELKKLRRRLDGSSEIARIEMLLAFKEQRAPDIASAARLSGVSARTLRRWWGAYQLTV